MLQKFICNEMRFFFFCPHTRGSHYPTTMPSRNSINKPKDHLHRASHARSIGKKRAARARTAVPTKSNTSRYNTETAPTPTESKALALSTGGHSGTKLTSNTLSNKRAKKIARNQKYIEQRNQKLNIDAAAKQEDEMDLDESNQGKNKNQKAKTNLEQIKDALWSVVEDKSSSSLRIELEGEGTTLGVQAF